MSLYFDLQERIQTARTEEATEILQSIWEEGIDLDRLTDCLIEPAAANLQLRFDTPHAMICLDSVLQLLDVIPFEDRHYLVEWFVRYLSGLPKLFLDFRGTVKAGPLGAKDAKKGYVRSLLEHKVNNAFYYGLRLAEERGLESFLHQSLEIAAHEVDFLGHIFIYTHALSRLCRRVDSKLAKTLIFQITEFLARRAHVEVESLQKEGQELDSLVPMALERSNLLGHNAIFAHKINQVVDHLEGRYIEHLCAQLIRNIENSSDRFSKEDMEEMLTAVKDDTKDPLGAIRASLTRGNKKTSIYHCRKYLENFGLTGELCSTLVRSLAEKDPAQPHYIIFPQAVCDLAQTMEQPNVELAMARVILMINDQR
ncbi:MAG: hypothetical protein GTN81_08875 [Proteobacteria bacterium]|nr:hypothetical protein [Pseudomonadota bacterium]